MLFKCEGKKYYKYIFVNQPPLTKNKIKCQKNGRVYCQEGFRTITSYCPEPLSNVHRCWLAMPLGAGFLHWVLACRTIEKKKESIF